jgi:hypothetical protein
MAAKNGLSQQETDPEAKFRRISQSSFVSLMTEPPAGAAAENDAVRQAVGPALSRS